MTNINLNRGYKEHENLVLKDFEVNYYDSIVVLQKGKIKKTQFL